MGKRNGKIQFNSFYCIKCGKKVLDLPRKRSFQHESFHRKKLYCFNCKCEINCIECKNDQEAFEFRVNFEEGQYESEKEESLFTLRTERCGQNYLG